MIKSNNFIINITSSYPPSSVKSLDTIEVSQNYYKEVNIPYDLFKSVSNNNLTYYTTNWIENNGVKLATRITKNQNNSDSTLLIKAYDSGKWKISIYTNDSNCQFSEIIVDVIVNKWASKLWFKCKGIYESDWLQWLNDYILESNGSWLPSVNKIPTTNSQLFWIWGMIVMIVTIIYLALFFKYGRVMLLPIIHLQTFY